MGSVFVRSMDQAGRAPRADRAHARGLPLIALERLQRDQRTHVAGRQRPASQRRRLRKADTEYAARYYTLVPASTCRRCCIVARTSTPKAA